MPIVVTPFAKVTSVSSSLFMKLPVAEYTAELGISGRMEVVVLLALELGYGVNAWMERTRMKVGNISISGPKFPKPR